MSDQKDQAKTDYLAGMKYKDIAEKYGVTINTVKSWKTRYKWDRKGVHTKEKRVHTKKGGAPKGNKNALGNKGGAPKQNTNAVKYGFFAKYLPIESLSIIEDIAEKTATDMIWDQIMIQYAAIVRAQQLMFVQDQDDVTRVKKKQGDSTTEWETQFAWDKHATFLNAQSRAMGELRGLIKQFNDLAHENDERRLKLEQMKLNIEKTKAEIKDEVSTGERVIIVNDKEAMRKALEHDNDS